LDLREESRGLRLGCPRRELLEFHKQFLLLLGQVLRRLDDDLDVHVAHLTRAEHRHTLGRNAETPTRLCACGDFYLGFTLVDCRHLDLAAERGGHHRDRYTTMQIGTVALKELVRGERQENVEIAGGAATDAGLAFAGEPDPGAVLDALRNIYGEGSVARHASRTHAGRARVLDHLPASLTGGTSPLQGEETLGLA